MIVSPEREWRCVACGTLLGIEREQKLHLRYKSAEYLVSGSVTATCHRCATRNETTYPRSPAAGHGGVS